MVNERASVEAIGRTVRRYVRRGLPFIGLAAFAALLVMLVVTLAQAGDTATGALEERLYIERTFYAILTVGLVVSLYIVSRGED